ncbi:hypothetical protein AB0I51_05470 [Streptomyces sp. NPDC050549]|uniref:hypothetical protein n=1 Tax=Streptomyces sp. NPDC050549 TaxID=3155406 RepID=UPI00343644A3
MGKQQHRPTQLPLDELATAYVRAGETLFLAVHDDIAARVRLAHPEAAYLEVSVHEPGAVELHGIWSVREPESDISHVLYNPHDDADGSWRDGPLDVDELVQDLGRILPHSFLQHWGVIQPHPVLEHRNRRRWVVLPPADRAATVAEVVRRHVPGAESLVCRFEVDHGRIAVGFEQLALSGGGTVGVPCPHCSPESEDSPWPHDVFHELAHLLGQLYALPHLRARHLTLCVDVESHHEGQLWQLVFPYRESALTEATRT